MIRLARKTITADSTFSITLMNLDFISHFTQLVSTPTLLLTESETEGKPVKVKKAIVAAV